MRIFRSVTGALVAAYFFTAMQSAAAPFSLRRGVLVDPVRQAAYVAGPDATIEAVDLASGRTLWSSADAALPISVDDRYLVAQVETRPAGAQLHIVLLDLQASGRKVADSVIELPKEVRALVADELERTFRVTAERAGETLLVSWFAKELPLKRFAMKPVVAPSRRMVSGSARIVVATGRVVESEAGGVSEVPDAWKNRDGAPRPPWRAGNVIATTEGGRGGPLQLKRRDVLTGQALPDRELSRRALVALPSSDQRHIAASDRVGEGGPGDPEYRWAIFALETAEPVGQLLRDVSAAPFFVWKDDLIFESAPHGWRIGETWVEEPLEIRSVRISTGVTSWHSPIRDLEYRGPVPPARQ